MPYYDNTPGKRRRHGENTDEWAEDRPRRGRPGRRNETDDARGERSGSGTGRDAGRSAPRGKRSPGAYDRSRPSAQSRGTEYRGRKPVRTPEREESMQPAGHASFEYRPAPATAPAPRAPQPRPEEAAPDNNYVLTGRNPIREALKTGRDLEKLLVMKGELSGSARQLVQQAKEAHVPVQVVDKARLDEIAPHHQGLIAFASAYAYATVEEMLALARERNEDPFLVVLDGVTDPHNLGAVIRSAKCVGAHGVIVRERRSVGLTPAAVKASAGAVEHVKVARVTNLNRTLEQLKEQGLWISALTMEGEDYRTVDFSGPCALVIGSEGEGISRLTLENCDRQVSLPLRGQLDSLNASVAAGIMMYRVLACREA